MPSDYLASTEFHDYHLLLLGMDSNWALQAQEGSPFPPPYNHWDFRNRCLRFAQGINMNYDAWCEANREPKEEYVSSYLFNPLSYYTISPAGDADIVLLDDPDPVQRLTTQIRNRVTDVSLAQCIRMDALARAAGLNEAKRFWIEPHNAFDESFGQRNSSPPIQSGELPVHSIQRDLPFLLYTKYRMDGLGLLGQFLPALQGTTKAMMRRIGAMLSQLEDHRKGSELGTTLSATDIERTRVCLLRLSGVEEIGALVFTSNLTVGVSIIAALRGLEYQDAFADPDFEAAMRKNERLRFIVNTSPQARRSGAKEYLDLIRGNHLFRWTTTSMMLAPQALKDGCWNGNGIVRASFRIQAAPGHEQAVRQNLPTDLGGGGPGCSDWIHLLLGSPDLVHDIQHAKPAPTATPIAEAQGEGRLGDAVEVRDAIRQWREAANRFLSPTARVCANMDLELLVPTVNFTPGERAPKGMGVHTPVLTQVLGKVRQRLSPNIPEMPCSLTEPPAGFVPLDVKALCFYLRRAGIPVKLGQIIEGLYQAFFTVFADPHRVDLVLDLYDVFATFHQLITHVLPGQMSRLSRRPGECRLLDEDQVWQISWLVTAMENALRHRIAKAAVIAPSDDMAVDIRGGMQQYVLAASAPQICSLGLFRRCFLEPYVPPKKGTGSYSRLALVGVATQISFGPDMRCVPIRWGSDEIGDPQLAYYDVDVSHVLHVASYVDYFHEAGHLVFRNIFRPDAPVEFRSGRLDVLWKQGHSAAPEERRKFVYIQDRLSEIFAIFFEQVFIFGHDRLAGLLHRVAGFSRSLTSIGQGEDCAAADTDASARFVETVLRLYMAYSLLPEDRSVRLEKWLSGDMPIRSAAEALQEFEATLKTVGPYYPEYSRLWEGAGSDASWRFARNWFLEAFGQLRSYLPWVWRSMGQIYGQYTKRVRLPAEDGDASENSIAEAIDESFRSGRPVLLSKLPSEAPKCPSQEAGDPVDSNIDLAYLICRHLQQYVRTLTNSKGQRVCLLREQDRVVYEPSSQATGPGRWFEFQIDPGRPTMFCPVPRKRRERALKQIVIREVFRDVASCLQGRRLWRLVHTVEAAVEQTVQ